MMINHYSYQLSILYFTILFFQLMSVLSYFLDVGVKAVVNSAGGRTGMLVVRWLHEKEKKKTNKTTAFSLHVCVCVYVSAYRGGVMSLFYNEHTL